MFRRLPTNLILCHHYNNTLNFQVWIRLGPGGVVTTKPWTVTQELMWRQSTPTVVFSVFLTALLMVTFTPTVAETPNRVAELVPALTVEPTNCTPPLFVTIVSLADYVTTSIRLRTISALEVPSTWVMPYLVSAGKL